MTYHYDLVFHDGNDVEIGRTCVELDKQWCADSARAEVYPLVAAVTKGMTLTVIPVKGSDVIE